ncbi:MAG: DUF3060 domain-containing protein [Kofleriaceae bacterium]
MRRTGEDDNVKTLSSLLMLIPTVAFAGKSFNDGKGGEWDCGKDPVVSIQTNEGTFTLKGACKAVSVNGNQNVVKIDNATNVSANGNQNKITVTNADAVSANGNENTITIANGSPKVSNPGTNNKINAGGASANAGAAAAPKVAALSATAVDCTNTPEYKITSGDGSYQFHGTCNKITVAGGSNHLLVENVKEISIAGSKNVVSIGAADRISVAGSDNAVTYKKGLSAAKPKVSSVGTNTKVEQQ